MGENGNSTNSRRYIGVKQIWAEPMDRLLACKEGLLRESECQKENEAGYRVIYEGGYVSWSPSSAFEKAYRQTEGMTFGLAIEVARDKGLKVARKGWNGKGMYVTYKGGFPFGVPANESHAKAHNVNIGDKIIYAPYLEMKTATGSFVPWLASQTDMLAEDWEVVE